MVTGRIIVAMPDGSKWVVGMRVVGMWVVGMRVVGMWVVQRGKSGSGLWRKSAFGLTVNKRY